MQRLLLICLLYVLTLGGAVGCAINGNETVYTGESRMWEGEYRLIETGEMHETRLVLRFKGDNAQSVGRIHYSYEAASAAGSGEQGLPADGVLNAGSTSSNGSVPHIDSAVKVTVTWLGMTEELELTAK